MNDIQEQMQHLEKEEKLETDALEKQRDAEQKLADAFERLDNEDPVIISAIVAAAQANEGQYEGSQALSVAIQNELNKANKNYNIAKVAEHAESIDGVWREIAEAERELKEADQEIQGAVKDEQVVEADMEELQQIIDTLARGSKTIVKAFSGIEAANANQ
jgi:type I restriction-modification system DNA methylase subunit